MENTILISENSIIETILKLMEQVDQVLDMKRY